MSEERFGKLEGGAPLPDEVKDALRALKRFENLEIGAAKPPPPPAPAAPQDSSRVVCLHCGQPNEKERETCWACFQPLSGKPKPAPAPSSQDITLVLDGTTYKSSDKDLPDDIGALMDRIRKEGYSQQLLAEWRSWRVTRKSQPMPSRPFEPGVPVADAETRGQTPDSGIRVFRGQRVSIIRIDGDIFTSDDPKLSPEMRQLFHYIERNGVTPALMEHLRSMGDKVKFRPADTLVPSDGDLSFWKDAQASRPADADLARREAALDLERAQLRYGQARNQILGVVITLAIFVLYLLAMSLR